MGRTRKEIRQALYGLAVRASWDARQFKNQTADRSSLVSWEIRVSPIAGSAIRHIQKHRTRVRRLRPLGTVIATHRSLHDWRATGKLCTHSFYSIMLYPSFTLCTLEKTTRRVLDLRIIVSMEEHQGNNHEAKKVSENSSCRHGC